MVGCIPRYAVQAGALCVLLLVAREARGAADAVIAPGQEDLLAEMAGRGEVLARTCSFAGGQVESTMARVAYRCGQAHVIVELRHVSQAPARAIRTERFSISAGGGDVPAELLAAIAARVRARERSFVWAQAGEQGGEAGRTRLVKIDWRLLQAAWLLLIVLSPWLCWRGGRALGISGAGVVAVVAVSAALAAVAIWDRGDEPLHANGHAWREAREVLMPWGGRSTGTTPFLHGQSGIALQWLLAGIEQRVRGTANPFGISRWAGAAAAAGAAFLAAALVGSCWAGLAAGCVLALMPLAQMLAVSGSPLSISGAMLPWSLALTLIARSSDDRVLLAGGLLAAALGTLSHTAMLGWAPALLLAWLAAAGPRIGPAAVAGFALLASAWGLQLVNVSEMIAARNQGPGGGLLGEAWRGVVHRNLFLDAQWVSPLLVPMILSWPVFGIGRPRLMAASVLALVIAAPPFFAVQQCSSDAVRYQGALLGLASSLAVAGLWSAPLVSRLGSVPLAAVRVVAAGALVLMPPPAWRPPPDPVTVEHRLVVEAVGRMAPGTLVVLPAGRFDEGRVIPDFPDFLLPPGSRVVLAGDPRIMAHDGPRLFYLGLSCISWSGSQAPGMRPECLRLREQARPWAVYELRTEDLPRSRNGQIWTFHTLATGASFGFFEPLDLGPKAGTSHRSPGETGASG